FETPAEATPAARLSPAVLANFTMEERLVVANQILENGNFQGVDLFYTRAFAEAHAYAGANGLTTLEMTSGGALMDSLQLFSVMPKVGAMAIWDSASLMAAQQANGPITAMLGRSFGLNDFKTVFTMTELPALGTNPNVGPIRVRGW